MTEKKKLSRQRRWQIKKQAAGLCIICGNKAVNNFYCQRHKLAQNIRSREQMRRRLGSVRRNLGSRSYQVEKQASARSNRRKGRRPVNPLVRALASGLGCTAAQLASDLAKSNFRR